MPSPIAHGSLAIPARAMLGVEARGFRSLMVWGLLAFAAVAPDVDIALSWIRTGRPFAEHGMYTHSLLIAPIFGVLFAGALRAITRNVRLGRAVIVGTFLYALHVLMDLVTMGSRGVSLFWPVVPERIASPFGVFVGVEHSDWKRVDLHLLTIGTEVAFGLIVWALTHAVRRRKGRGVSDA